MGVYVKGMEMPPACGYCRLAWCCKAAEGECIDLRERNSYRHRNCPLVEVAEPHGRLVDADVAQDRLLNIMCGTGYQSRAISAVIYEYITPTVIESEE